MQSPDDEANAPDTFELSCTDCEFERTVEGTHFDALEIAERHEATHDDVPTHFVELERRDGDA